MSSSLSLLFSTFFLEIQADTHDDEILVYIMEVAFTKTNRRCNNIDNGIYLCCEGDRMCNVLVPRVCYQGLRMCF